MDANSGFNIVSPLCLTPSPTNLPKNYFNFPKKSSVTSKVSRRSRSFTPIKNEFFLRSPELSPIECDGKTAAKSTNSKYSCVPTFTSIVPQKLNQNLNKVNLLPPPLKPFQKRTLRSNSTLKDNKSSSSEASFENDTLDRSKENGYLNHRLDVSTILSKNGLRKYAMVLLKKGVDAGKFLSLTDEDLKNLDITLEKDRKKILKIISDLNLV